MQENIKSMKNRVEREAERKTKVKKKTRIWSRVASTYKDGMQHLEDFL
jgi:hypothetical protein